MGDSQTHYDCISVLDVVSAQKDSRLGRKQASSEVTDLSLSANPIRPLAQESEPVLRYPTVMGCLSQPLYLTPRLPTPENDCENGFGEDLSSTIITNADD